MTEDGYATLGRAARHNEFLAELDILSRAIGDLQVRMRIDRWIMRKPLVLPPPSKR